MKIGYVLVLYVIALLLTAFTGKFAMAFAIESDFESAIRFTLTLLPLLVLTLILGIVDYAEEKRNKKVMKDA